ncbi:phage tail protein [Kineosporia babensis]|uniref:Phage tail protein n=1 Tax=Kineosporia babensis TaxID=499548 RepID=A0A9X1SSE0_9ACTN|nr:phage tail protein [Kineosporia babensis]MCD5310557.1 phage tail protein [Kineosporia babensis]
MISPHPLGERLPGVYADDEFGQQFSQGLDTAFAPLLTVLDCLPAYFDPMLAPMDFVDWLGRWVGAELDGDETQDVRRAAVASAGLLHRSRGTPRGLRMAIRLMFGVEPEISESGGAIWSAGPLGPFPGDPSPWLHVTLRVPDPAAIDQQRLDAVVAGARPAHIPYTVEVLGPDSPASADTERN